MTYAEAGRERLRARFDRFSRLMNIDAPAAILYHELILIEEALWMIDPESVGKIASHLKDYQLRDKAGYCCQEGCQSLAVSQVEGGFGYCEEHTKDLEGDACPGCGCLPGDGLTEKCEHPEGCGYWRKEHKFTTSEGENRE